MSVKVAVRSIIGIVLAGIFIGAGLYLPERENPAPKSHNDTSAFRRVQYRFKVVNPQNRPVTGARFYVYAPARQTSFQRRIRLQSSHPYELIDDAGGNQMLVFTFETIAPLSSKIISIQANLMQYQTPLEVPIAAKQFIDPTPEMSAAQIRQLARELFSENSRTTAENIYRWVAGNIAYSGYAAKAKGPLRTLTSRNGDCTEFADLFVALARSARIPARRVSGYLARENSLMKSSDYHDWAEVFLDGAWRIVDPQQRNFDERYSDYIAMKIYDNPSSDDPLSRFDRFYIDGKGLIVKMDS